MAWEGEYKPTDTPQFGKAAHSYARHRLGFPSSMYDRWLQLGILQSAPQHILDLGTGTGTIARKLASAGHKVTGIDIDSDMLAAATELANAEGVAPTFQEVSIEALGLDTPPFDLITAGQCWHWFDRPKAASNAFRLLKSGGNIMICHYDWLPLSGNLVEATERLILSYNPAWKAHGGTGIYSGWFKDLAQAGFVRIQSFSYDEPAPYSVEGWVNRIEASAGVAALDEKTRSQLKLELAAIIRDTYGETELVIPHRVFCVWGSKETIEK